MIASPPEQAPASGRQSQPAIRPPATAAGRASAAPTAAFGHRITGLDALRGLAALSVLLGHYTANYHRLYRHSDELLFSYPWAGYGVTLFFMISGFVILMSAERARGAADFAWARFSRLYPAYWTAILVTFTVLAVFGLPGREPSARLALVNLTMLQNLVGVGNVDAVYWTLHVELCFYAIIFLLLWRGWVRHIELVLLGLVALAAADHALFRGYDGAWAQWVREVLLLDNAYAFLIGVVLYRSLKSPRPWHAAVVAACLAYALRCTPKPDGYVAVALTGLMFLTTRGRLKFLEWRPLVFLGTISYSLYLTHQNIGYVIIRAGYAAGLNPNLSIALATVAALLLAVAITFAVERPAMALLRHRRPTFRWRAAGSASPARAPLAAA